MRNDSKRRLKIIAYGSLFSISCLTLLLSCFIPLHIDDVMYHIVAMRAGYDGWHSDGIFILCSNNFNTPIPLAMLPGQTLEWLVYYPATTPVTMRLAGVGGFVLFLAVLAWMSRQSFALAHSLPETLSVIISLCFVGLAPFLAVFIRQETILALLIGLFALLPFYLEQRTLSDKQNTGLIALFLLLSSVFFGNHPKTLLFAPLVFYAFWAIRMQSRVWSIGLSLLVLTLVQSFTFHMFRLQCPESSRVRRNIHDGGGFQPEYLLHKPVKFIHKLVHNWETVTRYFHNLLYVSPYNLFWLPSVALNRLHDAANSCMACFVLAILVFWIVKFACIFKHALRNGTIFTPFCMVPSLLLASMVALAGLQDGPPQESHFYDTTFLWLIGVCLTVILWFSPPHLLPKEKRASVIIGLGAACFLSQLLLLSTFRVLPDISRQAAINGALPGQDGWGHQQESSVLNYAAYKQQILELGRQCGISPEQPNTHLAVDRFTYLPFIQSYQPAYIQKAFTQDMAHMLMPFLKKQHSTGLIARCSSIPYNLQAISITDNGLCCIDKQIINSVR